MIIKPDDTKEPTTIEIYRGPNIGPPPKSDPLSETIVGVVTIKVGDNITTDHIIPAGRRMKYRSNISRYAEFVFELLDKDFAWRAKKMKDEGRHNIIVAGLSYGQGSSREHAAICPMFLGVKAVIVRSFERIHAANLINFGIVPLTFKETGEYNRLEQGDSLEIPDIRKIMEEDAKIIVKNLSQGTSFEVICAISARQKKILLAGGVLNLP